MEGRDDAAGTDPATYLIVLRHVLVAQDLAMTVREFDRAARVVTAASPGDALPLLDGLDRIALAFVAQGPGAFRESVLARALAARGARVVLMGEEAELAGEAAGHPVLARPFTTGDVLALLRG